MIGYHYEEWGVPLYNDKKLFEFMVLDAFQAGLSWSTVLNKRSAFKKAFSNFNYKKVAKYNDDDVEKLCNNADIIRNRLKIKTTVTNAQKFIEIQKQYGSFSKFIWQFVNDKPIINKYKKMQEVPAKTVESDAMSKALTQLGFKFVGSTICYAFMQAAGMVNDHLISYPRHQEIMKIIKSNNKA